MTRNETYTTIMTMLHQFTPYLQHNYEMTKATTRDWYRVIPSEYILCVVISPKMGMDLWEMMGKRNQKSIERFSAYLRHNHEKLARTLETQQSLIADWHKLNGIPYEPKQPSEFMHHLAVLVFALQNFCGIEEIDAYHTIDVKYEIVSGSH